METWLYPNRRVLAFGLILPEVLFIAGLATLYYAANPYLRVCAVLVGLFGLLGFLFVLWQMFLPRLAYSDGHLLVAVGAGRPYRVPIEIVEGFLLGHAAAELPGGRESNRETSTVVIRLAESAVDWHQRETKRQLAHWCAGYITLHGTWCEPLSVAKVQGLNFRLAEVTGRATTSGTNR